MSACRLGRMTVITSRIDGTKQSWTTSRGLSLPDSAVQLALQHDKRCRNAAFLASDRVRIRRCEHRAMRQFLAFFGSAA